MKNNLKFLSILCFIYISPAFAKKVIITTQNWPPYQIVEDNKVVGGIAVDVVKCALKKQNIDYEFVVMPWWKAQDEVKKERAQAFFSASVNSERDKYGVASAQIADQKWLWILQKNSKYDPSQQSFKTDVKIGVKHGTGPEIYLEEQKYKVLLSPKTTPELIDLFIAKRFDAILTPDLAFYEEIKTRNLTVENFKIVEHSSKPLVIYFNKRYLYDNPRFLSKFNAKISDCIKFKKT